MNITKDIKETHNSTLGKIPGDNNHHEMNILFVTRNFAEYTNTIGI